MRQYNLTIEPDRAALNRAGLVDGLFSRVRAVSSQHWLVLILLCYVALGLTYSLVVPVFESPDEPAHFAYVRFISENHAFPTERYPDRPGFVQTAWHPPFYYLLAAGVSGWIKTSDWASYRKNPYLDYSADSLGLNVFQHGNAEDFPFHDTALAVHLLRLLSLVFGAGTVIGTYVLARPLMPDKAWLALGSAALVAFLPQFIFISASVSNEVPAACLSTWALIQILRVAKGSAQRPLDFLILGTLVGLANLVKGSALALVPIAAASCFWGMVKSPRRDLVAASLLTASSFLVVTGWWYLRGILLYGDPFGLNWRLTGAPFNARTTPVSGEEAYVAAQAAFKSFWATFGWANVEIADSIYRILFAITLIEAVGLVYRLARDWRRLGLARRGVVLLGLYSGTTFLLFAFFWLAYPIAGAQGKYVFPAVAPIAIFFVLGLTGLMPYQWRSAGAAVFSMGVLGLAAAVPSTTLMPSYRPLFPAPSITADQLPLDVLHPEVVFGSRIRVLALRLGSTAVRPGLRVAATFYWQALEDLNADYDVHVRLVSADGQELWTRLRRPGSGRSPTDMWRSGQITPDIFRMTVPETATGGAASLRVGFQERGGEELASDSGEDEVTVATISIIR